MNQPEKRKIQGVKMHGKVENSVRCVCCVLCVVCVCVFVCVCVGGAPSPRTPGCVPADLNRVDLQKSFDTVDANWGRVGFSFQIQNGGVPRGVASPPEHTLFVPRRRHNPNAV